MNLAVIGFSWDYMHRSSMLIETSWRTKHCGARHGNGLARIVLRNMPMLLLVLGIHPGTPACQPSVTLAVVIYHHHVRQLEF